MEISGSVKEELISDLKALGLTTHESKVFITLLSRPQLTATALCNETSIPDSKIYYALDGLLTKGMIVIQRGRPNTYKALHPKEGITNLRRKLEEEFNQKIEKTHDLIIKLSPLYEKAEGSEEIEVAYILRGLKSVLNRMNQLIRSSRREILAFIPDISFLSEITEALADAKKRGVKIELAIAANIRKVKNLKEFGTVKILRCPCFMLILDMKTLITVSNWKAENCSAILTQDSNLISIGREYYDNPKCCVETK